jgi:glycosyltransferase involved in cell wall biosynthesis
MITILMPIKNGEEFMHESVNSVLAQTWRDWRLIIGINGLPPFSSAFQKARVYENDDSSGRICAVELPPFVEGKPAALNAMLPLVSPESKYVALLDVDDIWHPLKLALQGPIADEGKYDVIGSRCVYFGDPAYSGIVPRIPAGEFWRQNWNFAETNPVINSSCLIRKELATWDVGSAIGVEDYDLWKKLAAQNRLFFNCPEILVRHRIHAASAFNSRTRRP